MSKWPNIQPRTFEDEDFKRLGEYCKDKDFDTIITVCKALAITCAPHTKDWSARIVEAIDSALDLTKSLGLSEKDVLNLKGAGFFVPFNDKVQKDLDSNPMLRLIWRVGQVEKVVLLRGKGEASEDSKKFSRYLSDKAQRLGIKRPYELSGSTGSPQELWSECIGNFEFYVGLIAKRFNPSEETNNPLEADFIDLYEFASINLELYTRGKILGYNVEQSEEFALSLIARGYEQSEPRLWASFSLLGYGMLPIEFWNEYKIENVDTAEEYVKKVVALYNKHKHTAIFKEHEGRALAYLANRLQPNSYNAIGRKRAAVSISNKTTFTEATLKSYLSNPLSGIDNEDAKARLKRQLDSIISSCQS